jgi:hypothetical protein
MKRSLHVQVEQAIARGDTPDQITARLDVALEDIAIVMEHMDACCTADKEALEVERRIVQDNARRYRAASLGIRYDDFPAHELHVSRARKSATKLPYRERQRRAAARARHRYCPSCAVGWDQTSGRLCPNCGQLGEVA